jgi:hypothetical protein
MAPASPRSLAGLGEVGTTRPRIGLVINGIEAEYQWGMVGAALAAARSSGALLYVLAGGVVSPPDAAPLVDNALFDLVSPATLDAVVLVSSTMGHALGPEGLAAWSRRFDPLPVASIGIDVPGRPASWWRTSPGRSGRPCTSPSTTATGASPSSRARPGAARPRRGAGATSAVCRRRGSGSTRG